MLRSTQGVRCRRALSHKSRALMLRVGIVSAWQLNIDSRLFIELFTFAMDDKDVFAAMGIAGFGKATKKRQLDPNRFEKNKRSEVCLDFVCLRCRKLKRGKGGGFLVDSGGECRSVTAFVV